jgi:hypothetical protein
MLNGAVQRRKSGAASIPKLCSNPKSRRPFRAAFFFFGALTAPNRLAVELMYIQNPEPALRISLNQEVECCISLGVTRTVRNCPPEWLIDSKTISMSRPPPDRRFSPRRPFSGWPLTMVLLRGSLDARCIKHASTVKADLICKISTLN